MTDIGITYIDFLLMAAGLIMIVTSLCTREWATAVVNFVVGFLLFIGSAAIVIAKVFS